MLRCSALQRFSGSRLLPALARCRSAPRERGDVPGWVLVTIMTAGLVVALWAIAGPKLAQLFTDAMDSVTAP
jgi:hypothetical protein